MFSIDGIDSEFCWCLFLSKFSHSILEGVSGLVPPGAIERMDSQRYDVIPNDANGSPNCFIPEQFPGDAKEGTQSV